MAGGDLRRLVASLVVAQVPGTEVTAPVAAFLREYPVGGVVLFRDNALDPRQVRRLVAALNRAAGLVDGTGAVAGGAPLLVCMDQEGGAVLAVQAGVALPPAPMALGHLGPEWAEAVARRVARDLREMGVNWVLAPVADVQTDPANPIIGDRAYGDDPEQVARCVAAAVRGFQEEGVMACAKHFPGHGDTRVDSHLALPTLPHGEARLEAVEWVPFRAAVAAGVGSIMAAHIAFPALDPSGVPATLSRPILTGVLRQRLGFGGLICTDALTMRAIADHHGAGEAAVQAVAAGADAVLATGSLDQVAAVVDALERAAQAGDLPPDRVREAAGRVAAARVRWAAPVWSLARESGEAPGRLPSGGGGAAPWRPRTAVERAVDHAVVHEVAARGVAVAWARPGALPLRLEGQGPLLVAAPERAPYWLDRAEPLRDLARWLRHYGAAVAECAVDPDPDPEAVRQVLERAARAPVVLAATCARTLTPGYRHLLAALRNCGRPVILAALWNPLHLAEFPWAQAALATYGYREPNLRGLAEVLLGLAPALGGVPAALRAPNSG